MAGIYIHVPFCRSKCVYCGFYSVNDMRQKHAYLKALHSEINLRKDYLEGLPIRTIYFGGGTPSLLSVSELREILHSISINYDLTAVEEITLESNPEQINPAYCTQLLHIGINRLSIGIQSFQDEILQFMGRRHSATEAFNAIQNAQSSGFTNLSIDLIYGISERNDTEWEDEIHTALSCNVQHLSCYALTSEENSILYKQIQQKRHAPLDDGQAARQYQILLNTLSTTKFHHYEVSNFAMPGFESKHNSAYWNHTPYLGIGPAAHSFNGNSRQWNSANIRQYAEQIAQQRNYEEKEILSPIDLYNEKILLGLRTYEGINLDALENTDGKEYVRKLKLHFQQNVKESYYEIKGNRLRLTEAGLWFADGIAADVFIIED